MLQSGPVDAVFQRPASEAAARLLGARTVASGRVTAPGRIDVGGTCLRIDGPPLPPGPVGWAVRPGSIRVGAVRGAPGTVIQAGETRAGQRQLRVRIGTAVLEALAEPGDATEPGPCRVAIDPAAIQVWPAAPPCAAA